MGRSCSAAPELSSVETWRSPYGTYGTSHMAATATAVTSHFDSGVFAMERWGGGGTYNVSSAKWSRIGFLMS